MQPTLRLRQVRKLLTSLITNWARATLRLQPASRPSGKGDRDTVPPELRDSGWLWGTGTTLPHRDGREERFSQSPPHHVRNDHQR